MNSYYTSKAMLVLKFGIAFVFLYAAISSLVQPEAYIKYFPDAVRGYIPDRLLEALFSTFEILISLWILFGRKVYIPASIAAVLLIAIVASNLDLFSILFRNIAILTGCLALVVLSYGSYQPTV
jgi:uncharacterized membrane protein YphA (DoxX/SURF4 family)